jgi:hypothetical protein
LILSWRGTIGIGRIAVHTGVFVWAAGAPPLFPVLPARLAPDSCDGPPCLGYADKRNGVMLTHLRRGGEKGRKN